MTAIAMERAGFRTPAVALFTASIFTSAALVFTVQPLVAKLILPLLGGSSAVWNASMVFFQAALLLGYVYSHLLQNVSSLRWQFAIHLTLLSIAALALPLQVSGMFGPPSSSQPTVWLLATLAVSVGAPFAVLSATAPLFQAWYARTQGQVAGSGSPYAFYAASNLGSMLALLAYPVVIEPLMRLPSQTLAWTIGYGSFVALTAAVAATQWNNRSPALSKLASDGATSWRDRLAWIALAAIPSGLMLGVTAHLTSDVASAPFLWVVPLALYLLTFVIAFQTRPPISKRVALVCQAVSTVVALASLVLAVHNLTLTLGAHLIAFFFSTLVCHLALAERRPPPSRLTEFYMLMSLGGVIGGAATALAAPVLFKTVLEYPILMVLALAARPWGQSRFKVEDRAVALLIPAALFGAAVIVPALGHLQAIFAGLAFLCAGCALLISKRALPAVAVIALISGLCLTREGAQHDFVHVARSFFGVHRVARTDDPALGGPVHVILHGTTIHGAQPLTPELRCQPSNYFAPGGGIGQTYTGFLAGRAPSSIAVVGLGAGSVATFARAGDRMTFFEIDPLVEKIARDQNYFTYLSGCSAAETRVVIGDARLTMESASAGAFDLIHLDAFTSDAIPTHLMTAEALRMYLDRLKPDGIILVHISNRNMDLEAAVAATAQSVGAVSLFQRHKQPAGVSVLAEAGNEVVLISRNAAALKRFSDDPRWRPARADGVRPWTDDYTNVLDPIRRKLWP